MESSVVKVYEVLSGSIAQEAGIEKNDIIISINGEKITDIFDYRFVVSNENLLIIVKKQNEEMWEIEIEKDEYEDIGIEFETSMINEAKSCINKCIFCFIDQLPSGMRDTLYFKDDDSRLSFLTGNYVTLTNMSIDDLDRIIKYRMSPVNISVHTTNPDLRVFMLKNKTSGDILTKVKRLSLSGIIINCQIVLCKGINDGEELDRTIEELGKLYPEVRSISVVPVGVTKFREGLCQLEAFDKTSSISVVNQVNVWQKRFLKKYKSNIVYLADEFYIMSELELPKFKHYEDFPQIENGVGLIALLRYEFEKYIKDFDFSKIKAKRNVSIATGVSAYKFIKEFADEIQKKCNNICIKVFAIENNYFGEKVTVTGLLTGVDICSQLKGQALGDELLICESMIKAGESVFLDDYTIEMLVNELKLKIILVDNNGKDFIRKILGCY